MPKFNKKDFVDMLNIPSVDKEVYKRIEHDFKELNDMMPPKKYVIQLPPKQSSVKYRLYMTASSLKDRPITKRRSFKGRKPSKQCRTYKKRRVIKKRKCAAKKLIF